MEPVKNTKLSLPQKNMDLSMVQSETEKLLNIVENYEKGIVVIPNESLNINVEVDPNIYFDDDDGYAGLYYTDHNAKILRAHVGVGISFEGNDAVENVRINIVPPYNVMCDEGTFEVKKLGAKDGVFRKGINFRVISALFPTFSNVKIYATYTIRNTSGVSEKLIQSTGLEFELPLSLFVRTGSIQKDAKNKITLCTDKDPLSVNIYFLFSRIFLKI
jgi:hypothetical protein